MKSIKKIFAILLAIGTLAGCNKTEDIPLVLNDPNELISTPITDSFNLPQKDNLEGKRFAGKSGEQIDHYGYVTLRSCTDGDTANFIQEDYKDDYGAYISIKTRFLGVNTPESTAKVQPWGKKASLFTKHVLTSAQENADSETQRLGKNVYNIVLVNSVATFGERDSSGNRWLGFVWYRPTVESNWRLLNLELVEQAYSENQLFVEDSICKYRDKFEKAEKRVKEAKIRVHGADDPDYDYENKPYEYSLWYIINHYDEIGITEEGSSGLQLIVTALVVGIQGDNLFLRDILLDNEQVEKDGKNAHYAGLYAYAGYNSSLCSLLQNGSKSQQKDGTGVGLIVRFYCRATMYSGNVQLSDLKTATTGRQAIKLVTESKFDTYKNDYNWSYLYNEKGELSWTDLNTNVQSTHINPEEISDYDDPETANRYDDLLPYQYSFVDTEIVVRSVSNTDYDEDGNKVDVTSPYWYKNGTDSIGYTLYAKMIGKEGAEILLNIRVDASIVPFIEPGFFGTSDSFDISSENSPVGKTFHVTGYLAMYFEKFQIQVPNNYSQYNYIYEVK